MPLPWAYDEGDYRLNSYRGVLHVHDGSVHIMPIEGEMPSNHYGVDLVPVGLGSP